MQQVPGVMSLIWTFSGSRRLNQSRSSGPFAPIWKRFALSRATVRSLRTPPLSSSSSV